MTTVSSLQLLEGLGWLALSLQVGNAHLQQVELSNGQEVTSISATEQTDSDPWKKKGWSWSAEDMYAKQWSLW